MVHLHHCLQKPNIYNAAPENDQNAGDIWSEFAEGVIEFSQYFTLGKHDKK